MDEFVNFKDKVIIITGASSGIGAEAAIAYAGFGAKLTLIGRNAERISNTAARCKEKSGMAPLKILIDLTEHGSCDFVIRRTVQTYGRIDVLINCAGIFYLSSVFDQTMTSFDDMMAINLRVPYLMTQLAIPHLVKTKGNIVNIAFSMTNKFRPGLLVCSIVKTALEKFTTQAAAELVTEGVRINIITPGFTRTNIFASLDMDDPTQQSAYNNLSDLLPSGQILEPNEVAMYICLVSSDLYRNVNGANIVVDGGASLA